MLRNTMIAGALGVALSMPALAGAELKPATFGKDAPSLEEVTWIQGEPVNEWEEGEVYLLEFWATWCGPCIAAIPHVNDLAEKYEEELTVVGVHIWPNASAPTPSAFLEERRNDPGKEAIDYRVAVDIDRQTAKQFMRALGRNGIPTTMLIDQKGRLAWVGHPMQVDEPLAQIINGTYDLDAAVESMRGAAEAEKHFEAATKAGNEQKWEAAADHLLKAINANPQQYGLAAIGGYMQLLVGAKEPELAEKFLRKALDGEIGDNANVLNELAWAIATDAPEDARDLDLAVRAAERAVELTDAENASILDTLARVYYEEGRLDKAIKWQEKAVDAAASDQERATYEQTLAQFRSEQRN